MVGESVRCDDGGVTNEPDGPPAVLRLSRLGAVGIALGLLGAAPLVAAAPLALGWVLLLPVLIGGWALWVRTEVDTEAVTVRTLRGRRRLPWSEIDGFRFPRRSWARAALTDGTEVRLPAVGFNELREISAASGGRVSDPFAAAAAAREQQEPAE